MIWSFQHESLTKRGEGRGGCREGTSKLPHSGHQQRTSVCSEFHCLRMLPAGHASTAPAAARPGPPRILWHSCKTPAIGHLGQSVQKERGWIPFLPSRIVLPAQHGADIQSLHWLRDCWQVLPSWEHLMAVPAAVRMRTAAFSLLACPGEGSQTHWTGAGRISPTLLYRSQGKKIPHKRKGKDNFTGMKPPVKWITDIPPSHLCSHIWGLLSIYFLLWKLAASDWSYSAEFPWKSVA